MREIVIETLRNSGWYSNLNDETEGHPPDLSLMTSNQLLELYVKHGPF